ncbi:metallophosphoesterase family protein [Tritonibacter horizontis]|uniref:Putative metallophosphoesterase YhaO n=1 Tax=Tritonibacter horizontis TaxID=1768241 RepID=A0A132C3B5_9RHOB|nr:DNA repair exonuclease [Tritonibacter horizontis]KUP95074.1 putative metallophosphoesterase YhaO [Tritonibacter horizontis]
MRLIVSADTHLGSPIRSAALRNPALGNRLQQASRDAFAALVDLAIAEEVTALVLAGDIFDSDYPDLRARAFLIAQLSRAAEAGVETVLIRGNHDALLDHRAYGDLGPGIHLLHREAPSVEIGGALFHGLSFDSSHVSRSFLPDYPAPVAGRLNIGLMHTSLDGAAGHDPYAPCAETALMAHGYDLWCLGHIHAPFERRRADTLALMPGIPQPRHFGERSGGTVCLVHLGPQTASRAPEVEWRPVAPLGFAQVDVDLTACASQQDLLHSLRSAMKQAQVPGRDTAVRLEITTARHGAALLTELAQEVLEDLSGLYLDKVKLHRPALATDAINDDLMRLMQAEVAEPGFRQAALEQLEELRDALPPSVTADLAPETLDALLQEALEEVALALHAEAAT